MREALQLQRLVGRPLEARERVEVAAALEAGDEGLEGVGDGDDDGADAEDEGEVEDGEVHVGGGADFLVAAESVSGGGEGAHAGIGGALGVGDGGGLELG